MITRTKSVNGVSRLLTQEEDAQAQAAEDAAEAAEAFFKSPAEVTKRSVQRVITLMKEKQSSSFLFHGSLISLDADTKSKLIGIGVKQLPNRKGVLSLDGGSLITLNDIEQQALSDAADNYLQAVEGHAYDLIEELNAGRFPDVEIGWPASS